MAPAPVHAELSPSARVLTLRAAGLLLIGLLLVWVLHYLGQAAHDRVVYRELTQANQAGVLGNVPAAADALVARLGSTWVLHLAICVVGLGLGAALFAAPAGWLVRAARRIGL